VRRTTLAAVFLFSLPAFASQNHLQNSKFGTGTAPAWTTHPATGHTLGWSSTVGHGAAGSASVAVDGTQSSFSHDVFTQCVGVKAGTTVSFGGWFRYDSGYDTPGLAGVGVSYYTAPDCSSGFVSGVGTIHTQVGPAYVNTFQQMSVSNDTVPPTAQSAYVKLNFYTDVPGTAKGYFDDIYLNGGLSGDVNADSARSVNDVFYLINYLFAGGPLPLGPSDVNNSDVIDVNDVFYLINFLFAGGPAPL
jgi:hypothetical protein